MARVMGVVEGDGLRIVEESGKERFIPDEDVERSDVDEFMKAIYRVFRPLAGIELSVERRDGGAAYIGISIPPQRIINMELRGIWEGYAKIDIESNGFWSIVITNIAWQRRMICLERDYEQKCLDLYITSVSYRLGEGKLTIDASALLYAPQFKATLIARDGDTYVVYVTNTLESHVVLVKRDRESGNYQVILVKNGAWELMGLGDSPQHALDDAIGVWDDTYRDAPLLYRANPFYEVKRLLTQQQGS